MKKDLLKLDNEQCDDEFEKMFQEFMESHADDDDDLDSTLDSDDDDEKNDDDDAPTRFSRKSEAKASSQFQAPYSLGVCVLDDYDKTYYTDGPVSVYISTHDGFVPDTDRFKCYVLSDAFFPMCSSLEHCTVQRSGNDLTYVINCQRIWVPGNYMLLVRDKDDTLVRLDFQLDEQLETHFDGALYTQICGIEDILTTTVINDRHWQNMAVVPGIGQMRQKILHERHLSVYNELRKEFGAGKLRYDRNFLISTRNQDITGEVLDDFRAQVASSYSMELVDCSTLFDPACNNPYEHLGDLLMRISNDVICLTNIGALLSTGGKLIVKRIVAKVSKGNEPLPLWICGSRMEIEELLSQFPSLKALFMRSCWVEQEPATAFELIQAFFQVLAEENLLPSVPLKDMVAKAIIQGCGQGRLVSWSLGDIRRLVAEDIQPRYVKRVLQNFDFDLLPLLLPEDVDTALFVGHGDTYEKCLSELNAMVGLDEVKQGIATMANNTRFYQERRRRNLPTSCKAAYHCIFTGNPGTGKTTVARMLGRIYRSLGLLSKGEVIAVDRTKLVGRYIGETEENMKVVLAEAQGNVLFIDEAYNLYDGANDRKDFGARVIDSLLTVLSQPNPDMLVVFAGYEKQMDAMLNTNQGLMGRFPYKYQFNDYDAAQLLQIANGLLSRDEYILSEEAERLLRESIELVYKARPENFSNARWVEQFVNNGIIPAMANRLALSPGADYQHIEAADVRKAYERFNVKAFGLKPRRKVGFGA